MFNVIILKEYIFIYAIERLTKFFIFRIISTLFPIIRSVKISRDTIEDKNIRSTKNSWSNYPPFFHH